MYARRNIDKARRPGSGQQSVLLLRLRTRRAIGSTEAEGSSAGRGMSSERQGLHSVVRSPGVRFSMLGKLVNQTQGVTESEVFQSHGSPFS